MIENDDYDRTIASKEAERKKLQQDIEAFTKGGGKIEQVKPEESVGIKPMQNEKHKANANKARNLATRQRMLKNKNVI